MMHDLKVQEIRDADIYERGQLPVRGVEAVFMVGEHGPFTAKVPKTGDWSIELRAKIDVEVQRVRSFLA